MADMISVKMKEYQVAQSPTILTTSSLGSCVALAIYDPEKKFGGLAHTMLPTGLGDGDHSKSHTGIMVEAMIKELQQKGAKKERLRAKLAGGSNMFPLLPNSELTDIGQQNLAVIKQKLKEHHIKIVGEDIYGCNGRMVEFCLNTGIMTVIKRL